MGGCVTEYECDGWKLFVDYGERLQGAPGSDGELEIDGLTCGDLRKSALLITHFHRDHIGKIGEMPLGLPIYMSRRAKEKAFGIADHLSVVSEEHLRMSERLKSVLTFVAGERFSFGDFNILPIVIDHSAFDAYAFCIEAKELSVFHTGHFRTHGLSSVKLPKAVKKYIDRADYVVCEATNINRPDATLRSELEQPQTLMQQGTELVATDKFIDFISQHGHVQAVNHCDMKGLDALFSTLRPKALIPIHTDNPQAFADLFCDKWPVILLNDGEAFSAIRDPWFDITEAKIFAFKQPSKSDNVIDNPEGLQYWALDERSLGEFKCWKDAEFALHHAVYAPNRLLAYSIEIDEDMAPWLYVVYTPDFTEYSEYTEGEHEPGGSNYQEKCAFSPGEKVLAIIENKVLIPCTFIGPVSEEFFKEKYRRRGVAGEQVIEELVSKLWDWDWDSVIVRPLVKIETKFREISSDTNAQRIYIFPYRELKL